MATVQVEPTPHFKAPRRELRKGTHSCWECKRRKMKCELDPRTSPSICKNCRRRGWTCISQAVPEELALSPQYPRGESQSLWKGYSPRNNAVQTRRRRLSSTTPSDCSPAADYGIHTPSSIVSQPLPDSAAYETSTPCATTDDLAAAQAGTSASHDRHERLSRFLIDALPSQEDIARVCRANPRQGVLTHEIMTMPYDSLIHSGLEPAESLLATPGPGTHPVLIARYMLLLATLLQHLHPDSHEAMSGLPEPPRSMMERLVSLVNTHVTTNDDLTGSIEGLECVMIESVFQANVGNLRRSWVACRRALSVAQLMGLHRPDRPAQFKVLDPKTNHHPKVMWFRIVFLDRFLCLLLGLPQGSVDCSMRPEAIPVTANPIEHLERTHCILASQILQRNDSSPSSEDLDLTREIDQKLWKASKALPSKWFLVPSLDCSQADAQTVFWNTRRLFAQILHYNLLNQLHLPYMLRSSDGNHNYEYSRITCVNASREVLVRFIALRSYKGVAYSCRTVDFLALMAAMTLLLAHLHSGRSGAENLLAHQYQSDRAMIEQVQDHMREVTRLNSDALSAQSADLLGRLLMVDGDSSSDRPRCTRKVSVHEAGSQTAPPLQDDENSVSMHIPYFGIINISSDGISKASPKASAAMANQTIISSSNRYGGIAPQSMRAMTGEEWDTPSNVHDATPGHSGHDQRDTPIMTPQSYAQAQLQDAVPIAHGYEARTNSAVQANNMGPAQSPFQYSEYPELAAGSTDWALQGVDSAFFESLMRSTGGEGNGVAEWLQA